MVEQRRGPAESAVTNVSAFAVAVTLAVAVAFVPACRSSAPQEGAAELAHEAVPQVSGETASGGHASLGKPRGGRTWSLHIPNVVLTTHLGKQVKFYDDLVKGKVVLINFMYVTCTET